MTKMQNFKIQGCMVVIVEYNDRICNLSKDTVNLPKTIRDNIHKLLTKSHSFLSEIGKLTPNTDTTDDYIINLQNQIGCFICQVTMAEMQVKNYYWSR